MSEAVSIYITRKSTGDQGTFGQLVLPSGWSCVTGELPWRDNAPGLSCIPAGIYRGVLKPSFRFRTNLIELQDVPCRDHILIHKGNLCGDPSKGFISDVEGCILLGMSEGVLQDQRAVLGSTTAITKFYDYIGTSEILLTIKEEYS